MNIKSLYEQYISNKSELKVMIGEHSILQILNTTQRKEIETKIINILEEICEDEKKQMKKPETFEDLLQLQKILDEEVSKKRDNGFVPRKRTGLDVLLSLDDEFQEWLRELPQEYNFKTWKEKTYSREKELEEITDCLFFYLQAINEDDFHLRSFRSQFDNFREDIEIQELIRCIINFKENLFSDFQYNFYTWIDTCKSRGFTKQEILDTYWSKWQKNMTRIKGDWTK